MIAPPSDVSGPTCDVVDAADGRDALLPVLVHRPVQVTTETSLPTFGGYVLSEMLRRDALTRSVPIPTVDDRDSWGVGPCPCGWCGRVLGKPAAPNALLREMARGCHPSSGWE